jgi:hypothetical protein
MFLGAHNQRLRDPVQGHSAFLFGAGVATVFTFGRALFLVVADIVRSATRACFEIGHMVCRSLLSGFMVSVNHYAITGLHSTPGIICFLNYQEIHLEPGQPLVTSQISIA